MKTVLTGAGLILATAALFFIREATITRNLPVDADSTMEIVLRIHTNDERAEHRTLAEALFSVCQLQVDATRVAGPAPRGDGTFGFRLRPTLDESDRRQLEGCIEDARIDHVQGDVLSLRRTS